MVTMDQIKHLREKTGAGVMDAKKALEESTGDEKKALKWLKKQGLLKAAKKSDRATAAGLVFSYVHHDGRSGAMVELQCETDFVAHTREFQALAKELALQVCSMNPKDVEGFLKQAYIRDPEKTVGDLITETVSRTGENVRLKRFVRFVVGEPASTSSSLGGD